MSETPSTTPPLSTPLGTSEPLIVRPREGRVLAGVCAGTAERLGVDPLLVRVGAVVLAVASGAGVLLYLALALATPSSDGPAHVRPERLDALRRRLTPRSAGGRSSRPALVAIAVLAVLLGGALGLGPGVGALVLVLLAVLVLVLAPGWPRRLAAGLVVAALALGTAGAVWGSHVTTSSWSLRDPARLDAHYRLGVGTLRVDLSGLAPARQPSPGTSGAPSTSGTPSTVGTLSTSVVVGSGDAVVTVPAGLSVHVRAHAGAGAVHVLGETSRGVGPQLVRDLPAVGAGLGRLDLDVAAGTGSVTVRRAG